MDNELPTDLRKLADRWCERRALVPLRHFLPGYFALNGLSDGNHECVTALKDVLAFAKDDITADERSDVKQLIRRLETNLASK
jgi:hypothetical protein